MERACHIPAETTHVAKIREAYKQVTNANDFRNCRTEAVDGYDANMGSHHTSPVMRRVVHQGRYLGYGYSSRIVVRATLLFDRPLLAVAHPDANNTSRTKHECPRQWSRRECNSATTKLSGRYPRAPQRGNDVQGSITKGKQLVREGLTEIQ